MAATTQRLGELHQRLTEALIERIDDTEMCSAADLAVAANFLKANNITAIVTEDNSIGELERKLEARRGRRKLAINVTEFPSPVPVTREEMDASLAEAMAIAERDMMYGGS